MTTRQGIALVAVWVLMMTASVSAVSFQGLAVLGRATGVSADGTTAAVWRHNPSTAMRWTAKDGLVALPDVPGGPTESFASAVSGDGSLIVGRGTDGSFHNYQAAKWPNASTVIPLPNLTAPMDTESCAIGISDDGSVIVGWCEEGNGYSVAVRWTESGGIERLSGLGGNSSANDASYDGSVIVGDAGQAFRWTQESGVTYLGTLDGHNESYAHSVSADGSVVVGMSGRRGFSDYRAFKWTQDERMVDLGLLSGGYNSRAVAASTDGSRIVGTADSGSRALIWDAQYGMRDLQTVLVNDFGLNLSGWSLKQATGVSADGNTIVGLGRNPSGLTAPWIAVIPEPATLMLLAIGGIAVMRRRR